MIEIFDLAMDKSDILGYFVELDTFGFCRNDQSFCYYHFDRFHREIVHCYIRKNYTCVNCLLVKKSFQF